MKKGLILPLCGAAAAGVLGMLEIIPSFFAIIVILAIIGLRDVVLISMARGLPWALISQRIQGGVMFGVWNKQR